jgi:hypothetical protein
LTKPEITGIRELKFSSWIGEKLPDSSFGFLVTDLDFILYNWQTKKIMLLEIKTRNAKLKKWQQIIFFQIAKWIEKGIDKDWIFQGFHIIKFENTFFNDGEVCWDNKLSSEEEIKKNLSCI